MPTKPDRYSCDLIHVERELMIRAATPKSADNVRSSCPRPPPGNCPELPQREETNMPSLALLRQTGLVN
ncbi:MAG TPA: hypothetical protein VHV08_07170 [Pirellulales bacterium]|nr:hypothetical protein [Pirellulales bacterium]